MTPDELDAIRKHNSRRGPFGALVPYDAMCYLDEVMSNVDALLAEVDRLTADLADTAAYAALGRENERARIRAALEGLPRLWANRITSTGMESVSVASVECVERAAVLAAIDGEAT